MKPFLVLALSTVALAGCGNRIARLERMSRVETAVLTDANALAKEPHPGARPRIEISDPDRLAALETFLKQRRGAWRKVSGRPRPARFQLELLGQGEPIYTVWLDRGYLALAEGKEIQETRLSNDDAAELLACLGLPANYLAPPPSTSDSGSSVVPADWATPVEGTPMSTVPADWGTPIEGTPISIPGPPHE